MLTLKAAGYVDVEAGEIVRPGIVKVDGDRIVGLGGAPEGELIDLGDAILLPGLMDMEVNLLMGGRGENPGLSQVQDDPPTRVLRAVGNARSTLRALVGFGVVPVVNENDAVANEELKLGDNDTLAALVANLIEADLLVLLTDQQGLYDADPRANPEARLVTHASAGDDGLDAMAGGGGLLGRGGMQTKVRAARLAARSGAVTVIAYGRTDVVLRRLHAGEPVGTLLTPSHGRDAARKRWLAGQLQVKGRLVLDAGAVRVLRESGRSLLAVGVREVVGDFRRGEMVACVDEQGRERARGLVNYGADEARRIAGRASSEIEKILGYVDEEELIHRDNLVLV